MAKGAGPQQRTGPLRMCPRSGLGVTVEVVGPEVLGGLGVARRRRDVGVVGPVARGAPRDGALDVLALLTGLGAVSDRGRGGGQRVLVERGRRGQWVARGRGLRSLGRRGDSGGGDATGERGVAAGRRGLVGIAGRDGPRVL